MDQLHVMIFTMTYDNGNAFMAQLSVCNNDPEMSWHAD